MMRVKLLMMSSYICLGGLAYAAAPDPLEVCFNEPDPTRRLACFDQEMERRHRVAGSVSREQDASAGVDSVKIQKSAGSADRAVHTPPAEPVIATINRLVPRSGHLYNFELDNGQVWGQTETVTDLWVSAHDSVTITPGAMGGFFLSTRGHQSIRVYRVR